MFYWTVFDLVLIYMSWLSRSKFSMQEPIISGSTTSHTSLITGCSYPPISIHPDAPLIWRPIIIQSFVSWVGPDHYIVCSEPSEKIELGMLVQDNSWSGPLIVERVWNRGNGLTILRCKGRCHLGENMIRFLVVEDKYLKIPWMQRPFWRNWFTSAMKDKDAYLPGNYNTGRLPFPSHRFALCDYQVDPLSSFFCFCIPYSQQSFLCID